ncbi:glycosyltransferase [Rathayibacter sp. VKM Ac-2857]|uniref:glycosyltransferase n=1 Tax=Rathayibacter sp. VKM Ac-2857 TaxID=2739020 RepID=UPI001564EC37|nr:glycosyltransferase [Rathayibacter sp. VKM Ac-2857]NQX17044.1 glycosyltransferase [Rathayibacter sp. VKM Ac-2857]
MVRTVAIIGTRGYPSYYGGFETAVRRLAPYLAEQGWDVLVYGRPGTTTLDDVDRDARVRTRITHGIESRSLSTLSYGLTSSMDAVLRKPDVALVLNCANGFWLPLLKMRGIPTVVNVDGIEWDRAKWGRFAKSVFHQGAVWTARHADRIIYDAEAIEARWQSEFGREGDVIPYGGDVPPDHPVEPGLTHRGYALLVARFVPENTVPEFVEAAARISRTHDVVIVGSSGYGGPLEDAVRALATANPRVHWFGHVNDDVRLHSLWQHAGAYFHGHSVGGTNPALVQAMACGAPVVARDTVFNREVLREAGGFVAPEADAIADGVLALLEDSEEQERRARLGLERAITSYAWAEVNAAYEQSLLGAIASRRRSRSVESARRA